LDERIFKQIKNIEIAHDAWKKLEESFEGTQAVKGAKAYILKEKFASFKMKEEENVPKMFHRLQVLVNDLKALREEVKDKDFSYKFLRCLPSRFGTLVTILVRSGLDKMTPNQVLRDVMIMTLIEMMMRRKKRRMTRKMTRRMRRRRVWHSRLHHPPRQGKARNIK
jgi:hypothetical protein